MTGSFRDQQAATVHASPVEVVPSPRAVRGFVIATVGAFFLAAIGAVGTDEAPFLRRLAYWLVVMEAGALIGVLASTSVHLWGRLQPRPWLEGALITLIITLPLSTLVIVANHLFFGAGIPPWPQMLVVCAVVLMFSGVMTAINYATAPKPPPPIAVEAALTTAATAPDTATPFEAPATDTGNRITQRLPPHLRHARLLAIEAEDHYLRVYTDAGADLILMRLSDAIAELGALPGARTHRSWWVARAAVSATGTHNGRTTLTLANGVAAPVSRSAKPQLQADGWFN